MALRVDVEEERLVVLHDAQASGIRALECGNVGRIGFRHAKRDPILSFMLTITPLPFASGEAAKRRH